MSTRHYSKKYAVTFRSMLRVALKPMQWPSVPKDRNLICTARLHLLVALWGTSLLGVTASQLDLLAVMPVSIAGCGRLRLEAAH